MAAALLRLETVEPTYLDVCSVMVVDVMNFDAIMGGSSAEETARFLNALHAFYAAATVKFDCFLLESLTPRMTVSNLVAVYSCLSLDCLFYFFPI